ncbi:hypothetical protein V8E51_013219 [Hyaloscypha variabilis]
MAAYNCCITIRNSLDQPLTILNNWDLEPDDGSWQSPPPGTISPNQESTFQLEEIVAAPPIGTGASVCYRVILPDCDGVEWLILVNFTSRQGRNTFYTSSAFAFDEGQGRRSISCDFFALEETILPANGQALEGKLDTHVALIFRLQAYLSDIGKGGRPLNCYDQASIMLVCLALLPAASSVEWMFMDPFGLIKATALVGRGVCNNPFYNNSHYQNEKVCDDGSQTRSGFHNHAFVRLMKVGDTDGKIVDACTGPHLGNETLEQFIDSSIDKRQGSRFGTQDNTHPMGSFSLNLGTSATFGN